MTKLQSPIEPPSEAERIAALEARNAELELELQQAQQSVCKQAEAATDEALSLLRTLLEATADGILAINAQGSITHFNRKFVELWQVSEPIIASRDDWQLLPFMQEQLRDSEAFVSQVRAEYAQPHLESYTFLKFKDGKIFERYSKPQVLGEEIIGRVVSYRNVTACLQVEEELRQSEERFSKAFRANPAATAITDISDGRYIDVNDSFLNLLGFRREEVIGKTAVELGLWVNCADRPQVIQQLIEQLREQPIRDREIQFRNKSGEIRDGVTSIELIDVSRKLCMLSQLCDVTDRKRTEAALQYRLDFEALLTNISTQFINLKATEVDSGINQALQQIGEFAQVDRACIFLICDERFFSTHQWCADGIAPLVYPPQGLPFAGLSWTVEQLRQFKTIYTPRVADLPEPRKSIAQSFGVKSYISVPIAYEGCLIGSLAFNSIRKTKTWSAEDAALLRALADIFASALMRKRSEEALRQSEALYRTVSEAVPDFIWSCDREGRTDFVNSRWLEYTGLTLEELNSGGLEQVNHPDDFPQWLQRWELAKQNGETFEAEFRYRRRDGVYRWFMGRAVPLNDAQGNIIKWIGTTTDIHQRKQIEDALLKSEAKLNRILDSAIAVITQFRVFRDRTWETEFHSRGAEAIYGYTPEELIADENLWFSRILPEDIEIVILPAYEDIFAERTITIEFRFRHKDGSIQWISQSLMSQRDQTADCWIVTVTGTDITARKQAEEKLKVSLQEKEALLKEVHHRVKNNLQVISSLLDLQSLHIQEPQILEMFRESQNRVRSMALIHEKLYRSQSLSKVNLADYIESLAVYLIQSYAIEPDRITLQLDLEPIALNLDTAIPCGLILNELVSNALKHALPRNTDGTLWISLCCLRGNVPAEGGDVVELVVGNDEVNSPDLPDFSTAKTLGFQLVNVLVQQLNGQIEVSQTQGTEFKLRFSELERSISHN